MTNLREISPEEWEKEYKNYIPIDLRDEAEYQLGHIDNAKWMAISDLLRDDTILDSSKAYLLYCKYFTISRELGERLLEKGYRVANLSGGYGQYILMKIKYASEEERREEIEKSLRKKFKKSIFTPFAKAINDFELIQEGDNLCICISGGKDSMIMAKLFLERKRHYFPLQYSFYVWIRDTTNTTEKSSREMRSCLGFPCIFLKAISLSPFLELNLLPAMFVQD